MPRVALSRTIRYLPGKREQYIAFFRRANEVRQRWGLVESFMLQKTIDPNELLEIQVWDSEERYQAWKQNPERSAILSEGRQLRVREPTVMYWVLEA